MNIMFGDTHVQNSLNWGKGGGGVALKYHPGIKNMIKKITKILSINYHHKMLQQGIYI